MMGLTPREQQIVALLAEDLTREEIAARLNISLSTVKTRLDGAYQKLGVKSAHGAVGVFMKELLHA